MGTKTVTMATVRAIPGESFLVTIPCQACGGKVSLKRKLDMTTHLGVNANLGERRMGGVRLNGKSDVTVYSSDYSHMKRTVIVDNV
jgi:hypothetical protein